MSEAALSFLYVPCPDQNSAEAIAKHLIENKLAACVNISGPVQSYYLWNEKLENSKEFILWIKLQNKNAVACETAVRSLHPYETPCLASIPVAGINPDYMKWIESNE